MAQEIEVKVRFCETDALGHTSNISYFIYMEEARTAFFTDLVDNMGTDNWKFILASAKCDFRNQGYYGQKLKVITEVGKIGNSSFTLTHRMLDAASGEVIAAGEDQAVHFDFEKQKSEPLSPVLREKLERQRSREEA